MKKYCKNGKLRLVLSMFVCGLFIITAFSVAGELPDPNDERADNDWLPTTAGNWDLITHMGDVKISNIFYVDQSRGVRLPGPRLHPLPDR